MLGAAGLGVARRLGLKTGRKLTAKSPWNLTVAARLSELEAWREGLVPRISGIVTVVQEGRFRLSSDDGRSILFTLSSDAALEPQDLPSLLAGPRVKVHCTERPDRKAMTAHRIEAAAQ